MKRLRFEGDDNQVEIEGINMANVLMLLSRGAESRTCGDQTKVFACKTCNKKFASFQALGGHRASHKKPKLDDHHDQCLAANDKPKVHGCSICGVEFAIGQALGGHMRRHRATINEGLVEKKSNNTGKRVMLFGFELPIHG